MSQKITGNEENGTDFFIESSKVLSNLKNEFVRNLFLENLYSDIMDLSLLSNDLETGLTYAKKRLEINDDNKRAQEAILYVFKKKITILPISENTIDKIEEFEKEYPSVQKDVTIQSFKSYNLVRLVDNAYKAKEFQKGEIYLSQLESVMKEFEDALLVNREFIAIAYLSAGTYYYRFNKLNKAFEYLNKGLTFSPENRQLIKYLRWTKEEM